MSFFSDVGLDSFEAAHVAQRGQLIRVDSSADVVEVELTQVGTHLQQ
jgi:hypothetical protein